MEQRASSAGVPNSSNLLVILNSDTEQFSIVKDQITDLCIMLNKSLLLKESNKPNEFNIKELENKFKAIEDLAQTTQATANKIVKTVRTLNKVGNIIQAIADSDLTSKKIIKKITKAGDNVVECIYILGDAMKESKSVLEETMASFRITDLVNNPLGFVKDMNNGKNPSMNGRGAVDEFMKFITVLTSVGNLRIPMRVFLLKHRIKTLVQLFVSITRYIKVNSPYIYGFGSSMVALKMGIESLFEIVDKLKEDLGLIDMIQMKLAVKRLFKMYKFIIKQFEKISKILDKINASEIKKTALVIAGTGPMLLLMIMSYRRVYAELSNMPDKLFIMGRLRLFLVMQAIRFVLKQAGSLADDVLKREFGTLIGFRKILPMLTLVFINIAILCRALNDVTNSIKNISKNWLRVIIGIRLMKLVVNNIIETVKAMADGLLNWQTPGGLKGAKGVIWTLMLLTVINYVLVEFLKSTKLVTNRLVSISRGGLRAFVGVIELKFIYEILCNSIRYISEKAFGGNLTTGFVNTYLMLKLLDMLNKPLASFISSSKNVMDSVMNSIGGISGGIKNLTGVKIMTRIYRNMFSGLMKINEVLGGKNAPGKVLGFTFLLVSISVFNLVFLKMANTSFGLFKAIGAFFKFGLFYRLAIKGYIRCIEEVMFGFLDMIERLKEEGKLKNINDSISYLVKLAALSVTAAVFVYSSNSLFEGLQNVSVISSLSAAMASWALFSVYIMIAKRIVKFKKVLEEGGLAISDLQKTFKDLLVPTLFLNIIVDAASDTFDSLSNIGRKMLVRRGARIFGDVFFGEEGLYVKISKASGSGFRMKDVMGIIMGVLAIRQAVVGLSSSIRGLIRLARHKRLIVKGVKTLIEIIESMKGLYTDEKMQNVNWKVYLLQSANLILVAGSLFIVSMIFEQIASLSTALMALGMSIFRGVVRNCAELLIFLAENKAKIDESKAVTDSMKTALGDLKGSISLIGKISRAELFTLAAVIIEVSLLTFVFNRIGKSKSNITKGLDLTEPITNSLKLYQEMIVKLSHHIGVRESIKMIAFSNALRSITNAISRIGKRKDKIKAGLPMAKKLLELFSGISDSSKNVGLINADSVEDTIENIDKLHKIVVKLGKKKASIDAGLPVLNDLLASFKNVGEGMAAFSKVSVGSFKSVISIIGSMFIVIGTMVAITLIVGKFKKQIMKSKEPLNLITESVTSIKDLLQTLSLINVSDSATNSMIVVGVIVAVVFMMTQIGDAKVKTKINGAGLLLLKLSLVLPVFAASLLLSAIILRQVEFKAILIAVGYIIGMIGLFALIGLAGQYILPLVIVAVAAVSLISFALISFAISLLQVVNTLNAVSSTKLDISGIKTKIVGIIEAIKIVMDEMKGVKVLDVVKTNMKLRRMGATTRIMRRLLKRIKKISEIDINSTTIEAVKNNMEGAVKSVIGIFYDESGSPTAISVMMDSMDKGINKKLRKLTRVTRKMFRITRIIAKVANLNYATAWDSYGEPTSYAQMQKGDFEKATENMKACVTSILSVFVDENGAETSTMLALEHIDNRMKRKTRQLSKIVKFMSEITAIVAETASFKYATAWNSDGMPTDYQAITKDKLKEATENMISCVTTILSAFFTVDKSGALVETDAMKSLDNIDNRMKRKMRQLGKIVTSMSNIANTVVQYASMKFPTGYDDEGNVTGYTTLEKDDYKKAATNMMTCISTILEMFPSEEKTSGVATGLNLILGPISNFASKLLSGETLDFKVSSANSTVEKINQIIDPVSKMAQLVINFASSMIPTKWDENGNPIEYRTITETEYKLAATNVAGLFSTMLETMNKENTRILTKFDRKVSVEAVDKIVKYITPMTSIADIVLKMASTNIPVKWDANGNPIDYEKIPDDAGTVAAGHIMAVINGLVEGFSKENQKVIKSMKEKTFTNLTLLTEAISPIGDVMKMITDLCTGTTKEYVNGKETGNVIKFSDLLSNHNLINQTIGNIFNVIDTFISEMGSYVSGENQTKLTSAITGLNSMNKLFKPINDMIGITQKISEMDIDVKKSSTFCQFFNNMLSSKFTELNDAQVNSITKTAEAMTKINQSMKDTLANLSNATASENYKKSLEGLGNFVTKINSTSESKLDKMVSISKNLADFSGSIQGNFEKLAEVINEKLVDALEKVEETMNNLTTTIDNKEFNKPEEKEKVKLPQSMQTAGGPSVVPVKKEPDVKVKKKPEKERLSIGKLSDCIVNTPDGGVALAVVHLRP